MGGARQEAQGPAGEVAAVQHHTQAGEVRVWGGQGEVVWVHLLRERHGGGLGGSEGQEGGEKLLTDSSFLSGFYVTRTGQNIFGCDGTTQEVNRQAHEVQLD